jgi:virulence-associated protein VapD
MSSLHTELPDLADLLLELKPFPKGGMRVYAIAFDLVTEELKKHYSETSPNNAYADVRRILEEEGFSWKQGSVYFGDPTSVNAVLCVEAAQRLARELPWFAKCVRDVRMLRIDELNDLLGAVQRASPK